MFAGLSEFARALIREQTAVGRGAAKPRRVRFGRPRKLNDTQEKLARRPIIEGKGVNESALTFTVYPTTLSLLSALEA